MGGTALHQLWLFWVAPMIGAALAGLAHRFSDEDQDGAAARRPFSYFGGWVAHQCRAISCAAATQISPHATT